MKLGSKRILLMSLCLVAAAGCQHLPFGGRIGSPSAGPYTVEVVDASTGRGIAEAVVEWDYYFESMTVDPAQRPNRGIGLTDAEGALRIPGVSHPGGDGFRELTVQVTVSGYPQTGRKVADGSGTITFLLMPVGPMSY